MIPKRFERNDIGFLAAFGGLIFRPSSTIEKLFRHPKPSYAALILFIFLTIVLLPVILSEYIHGRNLYEPMKVVSLLLVIILTMLFFVFFESVFLSFFKVRSSIAGIVHATCYSLPALIFILLVMYTANYITSGTLSFVSLAFNSSVEENDPFLKYVPILINIGIFVAFCVFSRGLKIMGDLFTTNALILTLVSVIPFHIALIMAVITANFINPGTSETFIQLMYSSDILFAR